MKSNQDFTSEQSQKLEELFEKFYDLSRKIILTAKTTKMAIISQQHSNMKLDYCDIELAFDVILNDIEYIHGESCELSTIPEYLFWKNRNKYEGNSLNA